MRFCHLFLLEKKYVYTKQNIIQKIVKITQNSVDIVCIYMLHYIRRNFAMDTFDVHAP